MGFSDDVVVGDIGERKAADLLRMHGHRLLGTNKDYRYDLMTEKDSRRYLFEVKNDVLAQKTGNLAFEYRCRGKPSGLSITEAEWWVHLVGDRAFFFKVTVLKDLLPSKFYSDVVQRKRGGGDPGSDSRNLVVPLETAKLWEEAVP